ncbi:Serine/threonine-protein kinase GCN2 [Ceratocystis platani]|uniref:non-specific serine/threonine protein kinase n=1 Tax=Ceratocystis fimbriata f. sp. platani TaxID=88771 RepID=A0A0F8AYD7_CERFI|nr:Serine/threonine-protein kinase GCN2 [Ceratocystis platani]
MTAWKTPKTGKHVSSLHTRKTPTNANGATAAASSTPVSASAGSGSGPGAATPPIGAKGKENIFPDLKTRKRVPERLNYEELQANEIIVLESAYFDNFRRLDEGHSAWKAKPSFEIRLVSNIDADFALTLHVVFTATYPRSPPLLTVKDHSTLRPAALFKVQKYIETEPRNHVHEDEMMMTIALGIEEILNTAAQAKLDGNERSLELERADHEARLAERAQLIEQEANKRRLQEQEEEKQAWARQLQDEKKRQTESSKKMLRQRGSLASALNSAKNTSVKHEPDLAFDQLCAVKDASGNTNSFLSVAEKTPFKDGSVSKLSKVRPILIEGRHAPSLLLKETMVRCSGKTASQAQDQIQHLEQKLIKLQEMSHPRIVELLAYKIERDRAIQDTPTWNVSILTPLAERGSLEELLELTGSLNIVKVRAWTRDLLDALSYLHNRGIIHQDIHPRNVLLFRDERTNDVGLKLADISYQREFHNINDQNKSLPGVGSARSAYWLAPELAIDTRATPTQKSDVWDFGVVFLQLIFGLDVPLKHTSPTSLQESMDLSPPLRELVSRFFKSNAKKRPRAFELSSSEFLATDAPVMARDVPPMPDISTIAILSSSIPTRLRRDSMTRGLTQSRYAEDFVEEGLLGKGAFGQVVKARKKLDGQFYAIKKVTQRSHASLTETLKEVRLLSRISHPAVVRYYNTWVEEVPDISDISSSASADDASELSDIEEDSHSQASQASGHTISAAPNVVFEASKSGLDFISTSQPDVIFGYDTDDEDAHKECEEEEEEEEEEDEVEDEEDEETTEDDGDDNAIESDEYDDHETDSVTSSNRPGRGTSKVKSMPIRIPARKANAVFHNAPPSASASASRHPFRTILYISMEYCDQRTLRYLIARNIYTHPNKVWRLFRQILEGLAHIHALRIVHRDLKPENIFISQGDDGLDNVKIGDFGLATSGHFVVDKRANDSQVLADMGTKSIGTAFYAAPEVRSAARGSYSSKVDMYSLGLIFFEMCTSPCESVMERIQVTESLRQIPPVLPDTRIPTDKVQQGIILSLLTHDPETRPSAGELLKSGLLPVQMEGEAIKRALAGISDPNSQYYEGMLQTIFARPVEAIKDYNWASISSNSSPDPKSILAQSVARATLGEIFRRHGALEVSKAEIYPRARNYYPDNSTVYCVLGPNGTVLQMPFDLTLGHARFLATYPGAVASRTYAFGSVFRNRLANAPPEITGEVDFDIVTTDSLDLALKEAETIKVLDEIAAAFPRLAQGKIRIMISHSQILQTIFDYCKVDKSSRRAAAQILTSLNIGRVTFNSLRTQLRDPSVGVSATSVDGLARFDWTGQPNAALSQLKALLNDDDTNYYRQLLPTIAHIKEVLEYCKRLKVKTKIHIHPLGAIKEDFYTDGIMFSLISEDGPKQVLAAGGRYDALIKAHRPKMVVSGGGGLQERHAVGFSLAWERLTRVQKPVNKFKKKASRMAATEDMLSISSSRCDVLVASFDPELLRSAGLEILHTLWAHNIGAELASDARTTEELMTRYRDDSVSWLVIVKPEQLKIKSLWTKDVPDVEMSVSAVQLIVYLRAEMREKDSKAASKVKNVVAQQQQSAELGTGSGQRGGREQGVVVLVAQTRSKKFNRLNVIEQANAGAAALTKSFLEGRILAIETQDRVVQLVSETALSDAESWRRVEQAVPMNERSYMREVHATLEDFRSEFLHAQGSRHAFIFNFRTGLTIYYDLGR